MWGNTALGVSLGIATRPSLPLARRIAPAPSSLLDRVVVSATSPPRRRRHPDAPRPNASSWSQSCRRSIVSPQCRPFVAPRCGHDADAVTTRSRRGQVTTRLRHHDAAYSGGYDVSI